MLRSLASIAVAKPHSVMHEANERHHPDLFQVASRANGHVCYWCTKSVSCTSLPCAWSGTCQ